MIVEKKLNVNNRKKVDIVADLRKLEFTPFPKVTKAKTANAEDAEEEDEDEDEDDNPTGAVTDYDYLLGMPIYSLTREKIDRLNQQAREREDELLVLLKKSPKDLWNTDLDKFLEEWQVRVTSDVNGPSPTIDVYRSIAKNLRRRQPRTGMERAASGSQRRRLSGRLTMTSYRQRQRPPPRNLQHEQGRRPRRKRRRMTTTILAEWKWTKRKCFQSGGYRRRR